MDARKDKAQSKNLQEQLAPNTYTGQTPNEAPAAAAAEENVSPWDRIIRPEGTSPPQDDSFTLEDELTISTVDALLHAYVVREAQATGLPLVYVSPGYESLMGCKVIDIIGKRNSINHEYRLQDEASLRELSSCIQAKQFGSVEVTCIKKDQRTLFNGQISIVPVLDSNGATCKTVEILHELDGKATEDKGSVRWSEQVKHHINSFMLVSSISGVPLIQTVSTGFEVMFGYTLEECQGMSAAMITTTMAHRSCIKDLVQKLQQDVQGSVMLLCFRKNGAPFWGKVQLCPLQETGLTFCIIVDVTTTRQKRVGKYLLGKIIGNGSFGIVRKGKNTQTDELVAVKTINASKFKSIKEIDQIQEEISVLSNLKHPHIIRLLDAHFVNDTFYVVMELGSHGSLASYIYRQPNGCLIEAEAGRIFGQMASALEYCHRRRIAHRDLKPENVLMDEEQNIKIVDFGLAAVSQPFASSLSQQCGTPEFTAPEILAGKEYQGEQVDIWSSGVMLYEMLTGKLPFKGSSHSELAKVIQRAQYEPLPAHVSRPCKDLVRQILKADPSARCSLDDIIHHPWMQAHRNQHSTDGTADAVVPMLGRAVSSNGALSGISAASSDAEDCVERDGSFRHEEHGMHDSVRLVIPSSLESSLDDPITAAILARTAVDSPMRATSNAAIITAAAEELWNSARSLGAQSGTQRNAFHDSTADRLAKCNANQRKNPPSRSNLPPLTSPTSGRTTAVPGKPILLHSRSNQSITSIPGDKLGACHIPSRPDTAAKGGCLPPIAAQKRSSTKKR